MCLMPGKTQMTNATDGCMINSFVTKRGLNKPSFLFDKIYKTMIFSNGISSIQTRGDHQ